MVRCIYKARATVQGIAVGTNPSSRRETPDAAIAALVFAMAAMVSGIIGGALHTAGYEIGLRSAPVEYVASSAYSAAELAALPDETGSAVPPREVASEMDTIVMQAKPELIQAALELPYYDVPEPVSRAIRDAASKTSISWLTLKAIAAMESTFDPNARAKTSTASGLYQFIDSTWIHAVDEHASKHGYGYLAEAIGRDKKGRPVVEPRSRRQIMQLRRDPNFAAAMGAEWLKAERDFLKERLGREPKDVEMYIMHLMGRRSGARFLELLEQSPNAMPHSHFEQAVAANPELFGTGDKRRSFRGVMNHLSLKLEVRKLAFAIREGDKAVAGETGRPMLQYVSAPARGGPGR